MNVDIEFTDGSSIVVDFPSDDEIKAMREFSDQMIKRYMPNLDEIVSGK